MSFHRVFSLKHLSVKNLLLKLTILLNLIFFHPFVSNAPLLYPLKTSEKQWKAFCRQRIPCSCCQRKETCYRYLFPMFDCEDCPYSHFYYATFNVYILLYIRTLKCSLGIRRGNLPYRACNHFYNRC